MNTPTTNTQSLSDLLDLVFSSGAIFAASAVLLISAVCLIALCIPKVRVRVKTEVEVAVK